PGIPCAGRHHDPGIEGVEEQAIRRACGCPYTRIVAAATTDGKVDYVNAVDDGPIDRRGDRQIAAGQRFAYFVTHDLRATGYTGNINRRCQWASVRWQGISTRCATRVGTVPIA